MKILFYIATLGLRGGMENVTITKANALAESPDCEVAIAFADDLNYKENIIQPLSAKVTVIDLNTPFWDGSSTSAVAYLRKLNRLRKALQNTIDSLEPDIVVSTGLMDRYVFPFLKQTKKKYVKILEYHFASNYKLLESKFISGKPTFTKRIQHWLDSRIISKFYDFNAFLTEEDYRINAPKDNRTYGYVHNPVTFPIGDSTTTTSARDKIVLAVGRLSHQKNFASLLRIWANVMDKDGWRLKILGDGPLREELLLLTKALGIEHSVEIAGFSTDVKKEMEHASIFAATSAWEGLPLVLLEAMASGCPIISYRTPYGPSDIITNNHTGLLVNMDDETTYAELLQQLIDEPSLRDRIAGAARNQIYKFSIPHIISIWIEKYHQLISIKRGV